LRKVGRIAIVVGIIFAVIPDGAEADVIMSLVTCSNKDGTSREFRIGWDNTNRFFEGKGYIPRLFCEGGYAGDFRSYVSDNLASANVGYYNGVVSEPAPEPRPEPSPDPKPSPSPTVEPTPESSPTPTETPTATPSPTPTETPTAVVDTPTATVETPTAVVDTPTVTTETSTATINPTPAPPVVEPATTPPPAPTPAPPPAREPEAALEIAPQPEPAPAPDSIPEPVPEVAPTPESVPEVAPELPLAPEPIPEVAPEPAPKPDPVPEVAPEPNPDPVPEVVPVLVPVAEEPPTPEPTPRPVKEVVVGLISNNPSQLPTTIPKLPEAVLLVAHIQQDKTGVENGGIQLFGTQSQPQVIGEDGVLTPPPPPPGSGEAIPPDAITIPETFIGQPGGMTFNAPDIAVPVLPIEVNIDIPGVGEAARAMADAYVALANIGNDMSPITRKKAKKILVATIFAGAVMRRNP
jgi:hypothetical protein